MRTQTSKQFSEGFQASLLFLGLCPLVVLGTLPSIPANHKARMSLRMAQQNFKCFLLRWLHGLSLGMTAPRYTFCHFWLDRHRLNDTGVNYLGDLFSPPYMLSIAKPLVVVGKTGLIFSFHALVMKQTSSSWLSSPRLKPGAFPPLLGNSPSAIFHWPASCFPALF